MKTSVRFPDLRNATILRGLSAAQQDQFINACTVRSFRRNSVLLHQGEPTDRMYMVAKGRVEVSYVSETGHHSIIFHAQPGRILGAIETLSERPCAGTCTTLSDTTVLMCRRSELIEKLKSPILLRNFAADLHDMISHDNRYKSVDQFCSAEQKICAYLDKMSEGTALFEENQGYLADVVGCSRQTVNKELGRLRELGIIDICKDGILILDVEALRARLSDMDTPKIAAAS